MPLQLFENNDFLITIFNAIPFPTLVVDDDVRVFFWNSSAARLLKNDVVISQRCGEMLNCIHSWETKEGCGRSSSMQLKINDKISDVPFLITTSPLLFENKRLTLLILEDIHELMELGSLLPICSNCKKIRLSTNQWQNIEGYIKEHIVDVDFTHGLCPECLMNLYPEIAKMRKE
ncbi:MAG: hypothetical protein JXA06_13005 [Bacteroidetes bacterium]|nr:hypothetical protein [Bacteroidota bacterium]